VTSEVAAASSNIKSNYALPIPIILLAMYLSNTNTDNDDNNLDIISMLYAFSRRPI
jgi:hypothetical protein